MLKTGRFKKATTARALVKGTIEYKRLSDDEVLVIARVPGKKPVKTILELVPPEREQMCIEEGFPRPS